MPTQMQTATKRLRAAHANFVKAHKQAVKKASGSRVAGRLKKRRRKKASGRVMGFDVGPGWKKKKIGTVRAAQTKFQNEKNFWTNVRAKARDAGKKIKARY